MYFNVLVPPVIDGSESTSDILIDIDSISTLFSLTINFSIKISSPTPTVLWLRNGLAISEELDADPLFYRRMSTTSTGYVYTLGIVSANRTYQFVLDNVIGMYQCVVSNDAGQIIINRRLLFKCKLNVIYINIQLCYKQTRVLKFN